MDFPALIAELDVSALDRSLAFYVDLVGFKIRFARPDERFTYLVLDDAHLMLEEAAGPGRRFRTAPLERPYGRGVNLQIRVADSSALHASLCGAGVAPYIPLEERWYAQDDFEIGLRQFVVADPDGYLLRFATDLGRRPGQR